jgi:hypothetical protein
MHGASYGKDGVKNPTAEEWAAFAASCNLRDMGTRETTLTDHIESVADDQCSIRY